MIVIEDKELIQRFIETSYLVKSAVSEQNLANAQKRYQELYSIYQQITASKLEHIHKEVAYQQVIVSYHLIEDLRSENIKPTNMIAIAIVIVIISTIIFINPRMIGLAVFQEKISQPVTIAFTQSGSETIHATNLPTSLSVSGTIEGRGTARLFLDIDGKQLLIFDSSRTKIKDGAFSTACIDTCVLPKLGTTNLHLSADLHDTKLTITNLQYYSRAKNNPPRWNNEPKTITINGETTVDFSPDFTDPDGDELVYLPLVPKDIHTSVKGSVITFTPESSIHGTRNIELLVSDLQHTTRAAITLDVR